MNDEERRSEHVWSPIDGVWACTQCGVVRNLDKQTRCRGALPAIKTRDKDVDGFSEDELRDEVRRLRRALAGCNASRVGLTCQAAELRGCLAFVVRCLEQEARDGDGIREEFFFGYQGALSALERTKVDLGDWEAARAEAAHLMRKASEVPGLSAALDEARKDAGYWRNESDRWRNEAGWLRILTKELVEEAQRKLRAVRDAAKALHDCCDHAEPLAWCQGCERAVRTRAELRDAIAASEEGEP